MSCRFIRLARINLICFILNILKNIFQRVKCNHTNIFLKNIIRYTLYILSIKLKKYIKKTRYQFSFYFSLYPFPSLKTTICSLPFSLCRWIKEKKEERRRPNQEEQICRKKGSSAWAYIRSTSSLFAGDKDRREKRGRRDQERKRKKKKVKIGLFICQKKEFHLPLFPPDDGEAVDQPWFHS